MFNPTQRPRRGPLLTHYIEIVSHHIDFSKMSHHLTDKKKKFVRSSGIFILFSHVFLVSGDDYLHYILCSDAMRIGM